MGDHISTGNISHSAVAIGRGNSATNRVSMEQDEDAIVENLRSELARLRSELSEQPPSRAVVAAQLRAEDLADAVEDEAPDRNRLQELWTRLDTTLHGLADAAPSFGHIASLVQSLVP